MAKKQSGNEELSFISTGTTIEGSVKSEGNVRVDGKLVGDLVVKANAAVGLAGVVEGTVQATNISVAGKVHGTVTATEKLILESKAVMRGDIRASRLVIDEGAMFDGECSMTVPQPAGRSVGQRD